MVYIVNYEERADIRSEATKETERTLPVYYEYSGKCFEDDLARAFARAEEAGEACQVSEIPESYLSDFGITYLKPAGKISMEDRKAVRDPWEVTGLMPCNCTECTQYAFGYIDGDEPCCLQIMDKLLSSSESCEGFTNRYPSLYYSMRYQGKNIFAFHSKGIIGIAMLDSRAIAQRYLQVRRFSLGTLCQMLGWNGEEKHRAAEDCKQVLWLLRALEQRPFEALVNIPGLERTLTAVQRSQTAYQPI